MGLRVVGMVIVAGILLLSAASIGGVIAIGLAQGFSNVSTGDHVAVVEVHGEIVSRDSGGLFAGGAASADRLASILTEVRESGAKALILDIDSPGGGVVASELIHRELLKVREDGIPIVAYFENSATSGAYYISTPANQIISMPSAITGSLGVIASVPNMEELYEKIGIDMQIIKSGEFKDMFQPNRPMTEDEREIMESIIAESQEDFVQRIVDGRDLSRSDVEDLADGRIYSGRQALENGLVDQLGSYEDALATAGDLGGTGSDPRVVNYSGDPSFPEVFLNGAFQRLGIDLPFELSSPDTHITLRY